MALDTYEGFEDGDTAEWSEGYLTTQSSTVYEGDFAGTIASASSGRTDVSTSGLSPYPRQGTVFRYYIRLDQASDTAISVGWGVQNTDNYYRANLQTWTDTFRIEKADGGNRTTLADTSENVNADTWYYLEVDWQSDGQMTASLHTASGSQQASITTTDNTYTDGGILCHFYDGSGGGNDGHFDNFQTDATVETPQNLNASAQQTTISLDWDEVLSADDYNIYRDSSGAFTLIDTIAAAKNRGFEDMSYWSTYSGGQASDRVHEGSYSYHSGNDNSGEQARLTDNGGTRFASIVWYQQETSNSTGSGVRFKNSNGNYEGGVALDNPGYEADFANTSGQVNSGGSYDEWIKFVIDFDWANATVSLSIDGLSSGNSYSATHALKQGVDIEQIECWNYASGTWGDGGLDAWWDGVELRESPTYDDSGLAEGVTYSYAVSAVEGEVESDKSTSASATTALPAPSSPTIAPSSPTSADTTWTDNSSNEDGFEAQVSEDGGAWGGATTVGANTTSAAPSVSSASIDTIKVRVRAYTADANSDWAASPTIATNVKNIAVDATRDTAIDVSWADGDKADEYHIYRAESPGGSYSQVGTASSRSHTDTGLENGKQYYYRVAAVYGGGEDALSSESSGITDLPAATWNSIDSSVEGEVSLDWAKTDNNTGGRFEVRRNIDGTWRDGGDEVVASLDIGTTTYTDTGRSDGEKYYYKVSRVTTDDDTVSGAITAVSDSAERSSVTVLPAPTGLTVDAVDGDQADVSWTVNHDYGDQRVEIKPTDSDTWQDDSGTLSRATTSYTTTNLLDGEKYDLRTLAVTEHTTTEDN